MKSTEMLISLIDAMFDKSDEVASSNDPDVTSLSDHQNDEISGSNENEFEPPTGQSSVIQLTKQMNDLHGNLGAWAKKKK